MIYAYGNNLQMFIIIRFTIPDILKSRDDVPTG